MKKEKEPLDSASVKSWSAYLVLLGRCLLPWKFRSWILGITLSTLETKYNFQSQAIRILIPFRKLTLESFSHLGNLPANIKSTFYTCVFESLTQQATNRMKHLALKYNHLWHSKWRWWHCSWGSIDWQLRYELLDERIFHNFKANWW
jgi:hypothetical protein